MNSAIAVPGEFTRRFLHHLCLFHSVPFALEVFPLQVLDNNKNRQREEKERERESAKSTPACESGRLPLQLVVSIKICLTTERWICSCTHWNEMHTQAIHASAIRIKRKRERERNSARVTHLYKLLLLVCDTQGKSREYTWILQFCPNFFFSRQLNSHCCVIFYAPVTASWDGFTFKYPS